MNTAMLGKDTATAAGCAAVAHIHTQNVHMNTSAHANAHVHTHECNVECPALSVSHAPTRHTRLNLGITSRMTAVTANRLLLLLLLLLGRSAPPGRELMILLHRSIVNKVLVQ